MTQLVPYCPTGGATAERPKEALSQLTTTLSCAKKLEEPHHEEETHLLHHGVSVQRPQVPRDRLEVCLIQLHYIYSSIVHAEHF